MTEERLPLAELLAKAGDEDFLRAVAEAVVQMLMEADVEGLIGAARHERSGERTTYRNGYRDRAFDTRLGSLQLRIPKLRQGSYFPPFLEPRRTTERALVAVIQEAWVGGVSTRKADDLVQAMGGGGQGSIGVADGIPPEGRRGSARARSAGCAATSTSGSAPSSPARSPAPGRVCGSTRRVCASARAGGWSRWRR
jgi:transposase-like protein